MNLLISRQVRAVRNVRGHGAVCPFTGCGGTLTPVRLSGKDTQGRPLRKRQCNDCGRMFATIEVAIPAKFSEVDDTHQRSSTAAMRRRFGWNARPSRRLVRSIYVKPVVARRSKLPEWEDEVHTLTCPDGCTLHE